MAEQVAIDPEIWDLIPEYLERRRADVVALREALERGDCAALAEIGHKIRGSGGSYGLARISELGRSLERAAAERDTRDLARRVEELATHLDLLEPIRR